MSNPSNIVDGKPSDGAMRFGLISGALGVASGFAVFAYSWYASRDSGLVRVLLGMLLAAVMSMVFEAMRERVQRLGGADVKPSSPAFTISGLMMSVILLFTFDIMLSGWHALPELKPEEVQELGMAVTGVKTPPWISLLSLIGLWVLTGAGMAASLTKAVGLRGPMGRRVGRGALRGGISALVIAPLLVLGYVVLVRVVLAFQLFLFDGPGWAGHLESLRRSLPDWLPGWFSFPFFAIDVINDLATRFGPVGRPLMVTLAVGFLIWRWMAAEEKDRGPVGGLMLFGLVVIVLAPLAKGLGLLLQLMGACCLVWMLPGMMLGALAPLLSRPSENKKVWGFLALGAAFLLLVITLLRLDEMTQDARPLAILTLVVLAAGGALSLTRRQIHEFWPFLALSTGTLVWCLTVLIHNLTFGGVFQHFHSVNSIPAGLDPAPPRGLPAEGAPTWNFASALRFDSDSLLGSVPLWDETLSRRAALEFDATFASETTERVETGLSLPFPSKIEAARTMARLIREELDRTEEFLGSLSSELPAAHDSPAVLRERLESLRQAHLALAESFRGLRVRATETSKKSPEGRHPSEFLPILESLERLEAELARQEEMVNQSAKFRKGVNQAMLQVNGRLRSLDAAGKRLDLMQAGLEPLELFVIRHSDLVSRRDAAVLRLGEEMARVSKLLEAVPTVTEQEKDRGQFQEILQEVRAESSLVMERYSALGAQRLELALVSCFGFWATIGILIAWGEAVRMD